jgi:hypothetical protein
MSSEKSWTGQVENGGAGRFPTIQGVIVAGVTARSK